MRVHVTAKVYDTTSLLSQHPSVVY